MGDNLVYSVFIAILFLYLVYGCQSRPCSSGAEQVWCGASVVVVVGAIPVTITRVMSVILLIIVALPVTIPRIIIVVLWAVLVSAVIVAPVVGMSIRVICIIRIIIAVVGIVFTIAPIMTPMYGT